MTAALASALLAACGAGSTADDPVSVATQFLSAVRAGACDRAWTLLSRGTQDDATAHARERERHRSYAGELIPTPQQVHCTGGTPHPGKSELLADDGTAAEVSVLYSEGTHLALIPFLSTPYKEWRATLRLVKEAGVWKIDFPRIAARRPGVAAVMIGDVEVSRGTGGDPRRESFHAEAVVRAPRDALEQALMNPAAWPRFMPAVKAVTPVSEPDATGARNWQVRFEDASGAAATTVVQVRPYGHPRDPSLPWTTIQWRVTDHPDRGSRPERPLYTGEFELRERFEGWWVTYRLVIQTDEWPAGLRDTLLAPSAAAAAVTGLERIARERAGRS